MTAVVLEFKIR